MRGAAVVLMLACSAMTHAEEGKYTLKTAETPLPNELSADVKALLAPTAVQVLDPKGELLAEVWFRKAVPAKATPEQVKNGLTYREIPETTLLGAIRYAKFAADYRDQKIKPGVYTLRLGLQPQNGDHMGTSPYPEFCILAGADKDAKPAPMEPKDLHSLSSMSLGGNHPGVLLLFPNAKPEAQPKLADKGMNHWVVMQQVHVEVNGKTVPFGLGLAVVGVSAG